MPDKKKKVTNQSASSKIQSYLSNTKTTFTKSDTKKYPYLGSQFQFDTKVFNPMKNQGPTQRGYKYSTSDGTVCGSGTHSSREVLVMVREGRGMARIPGWLDMF